MEFDSSWGEELADEGDGMMVKIDPKAAYHSMNEVGWSPLKFWKVETWRKFL